MNDASKVSAPSHPRRLQSCTRRIPFPTSQLPIHPASPHGANDLHTRTVENSPRCPMQSLALRIPAWQISPTTYSDVNLHTSAYVSRITPVETCVWCALYTEIGWVGGVGEMRWGVVSLLYIGTWLSNGAGAGGVCKEVEFALPGIQWQCADI
jgi:hypothetical protein